MKFLRVPISEPAAAGRVNTVSCVCILLAIGTLACEVVAGPACPTSRYGCGAYGSYTPDTYTTEPRLSHECRLRFYYYRIDWDLSAGSAWGEGDGGDLGSYGDMAIEDDYQVSGLPTGTPLSFTAHLRVQGAIFYAGNIAAWLSADGASSSLHVYATEENPTITLDSTLHVTIVSSAGTPFRVSWQLLGIAGRERTNGTSSSSVALSFSGLPRGASITSCQGYTQDFPIAVVPASWSSLKVRFLSISSP
jgi:hypothetical protein